FNTKIKIGKVSFEISDLKDGEVKVRTHFSLMSTGTENIVFNRNFDPGTHWDKWVKYPFYPGYTCCGVVEELGKNVSSIKKGDRVAITRGHASAHIVSEADCIKIPDSISDSDAPWFKLAKISAMAARVANLSLGSSVLIVGAGPIGQMAIRWCSVAGSFPIIVVDSVKMRIEMAKKGGASHCISKSLSESFEEIKKICGGDGPQTVIDSTGHYQVFQDVLKIAGKFGRVVILGDTGSPANQHLSSEVMTKGLHIVAAHDCHETPNWNFKIISNLFFEFVKSGKFSLEGLNTHIFEPEQYREAYKIANEKRGETMGILFKWN
ncbi:MAG TPA: zinc-binding alcohol dehydrogenase, partial [Victivallales bacterium]|nr:zinc-binding alcohol dehydrogenase [Victivallales bacterium]